MNGDAQTVPPPPPAGTGREGESAAASSGCRWFLLDAVSLILFDVGAIGLGAWVKDLAGGGAAGRLLGIAVRPALVLPVVLAIAMRWWKATPAEVGIARPPRGSWTWAAKFAAAVGAAYALLGAVLVLACRAGWIHVSARALAAGARNSVTGPAEPVAFALAGIVVAPLVEELVFRGILYPVVRARMRAPWAVLVSALVFAAMHPVWNWAPLIPVTQLLGGIIFAIAYEKTRSLVFPVLFHAIGNGAILAWGLAATYRPGWIQALVG